MFLINKLSATFGIGVTAATQLQGVIFGQLYLVQNQV